MKKGYTLIAAVFILLVMALIAIATSTLVSSEAMVAVKNHQSLRAFYIASAGMELYFKELMDSEDWSTPPQVGPSPFAGGVFVSETTDASSESVTFTVTGLVTVEGITYRRVIGATLAGEIVEEEGLPENFDYSMYISPPGGGETLYIQGDARIYGDFFYYGPIAMGGSAHQLDGTVYSISISLSGTASYDEWEPISIGTVPDWDNSYYDAITEEALTYASQDLNLGYGDSIDLNGQTHYYRNISVNWGATVNGPGVLCSTGNPSGNGDIIINYGVGIGQGVRFIAARDFIYQGGSNFVNSIEAYANRRVRILSNLSVPANSVLYSTYNGTGAIEVNPGQVYRSLMLCPYGEFSFGGGQYIEGLVYATNINASSSGTFRGAMVSYGASALEGSLHIYYDPSVLPATVPGFEYGGSTTGSTEVSDWREYY